MTGADVYYRAYLAFKRAEADGYIREREKIKESISLIADSSDLCEYSYFECNIESDWIIAIEEGLEHVEKTIEAQRRFIKYEGETVRIEKAKRTTIESVKHLSKHSNLIKEERGDSVMPEKLYVVENEENFAVYENRFIYMLLTMLNDFVAMRYKAMTDARTRARYTFCAKRNITAAGRKISFDVSFDEYSSRLDVRSGTKEDELYGRVGVLLTRIVSYLDTPLMKIVSQSPLLKPPIVRTNVLKMNPHFFAAYELYTYILAYSKDGYEINENRDSIKVFDDRMCELLCDCLLFQANIAYIGSEKIRRSLDEAYEAEEAERRANAEKAREERLALLKAKLDSGEIDVADYIKALEAEMETVRGELAESYSEVSALSDKYRKLQNDYERSGEECERLRQQNAELEKKIEENEKQFRLSVQEVRSECALQLREQDREFALEREAFEAKMQKKEEEIQGIRREFEKREEELTVAFNSRLRASRLANGEGINEDNSVFREDFVRLELEKKAFDSYYKTQWSSAKKNIRKQLLWNKPVPEKSESADVETASKNDKES